MKAILLVLLLALALVPVLSVCGDKLCETPEIGNCADCATTNQNYACDVFPNDLPKYDPDCNTTVGQTCYDSLFTYSSGRGASCYPGNCTEGTGCVTSCTQNSQCTSGFCIAGSCQAVCNNCDYNTSLEVYPSSTTIYFGAPTFVSFRVNGAGMVSVSSEGPCTQSYDTSLDLTGGYNIAIVKLSECEFSGIGSVKLTVNGNINGTVHFLSYPSLIYSIGEVPKGVVGFSSMSSILAGHPVEVKTWTG